MAALALSSFLVATYTLAFLASNAYADPHANNGKAINSLQPDDEQVVLNTLTVSLPIPVLPPVTMTTLPAKSGISSTANLDFGAK